MVSNESESTAVASPGIPALAQLALEELLISGGDERMHLNKQGVNKYFAKPKPVDGLVIRSSCTGSNPSVYSFNAAQLVLDSVKDGKVTFESQMDLVRARLIKLLGLADLHGLDVVINPSGTDCEFTPLLAALAVLGRPLRESDAADPPIVNIITAGGEVGSMSPTAASGAHFQLYTPSGDACAVGAPLDGVPKGAVKVVEVVYRDSNGAVVDRSNDAVQLARESLESGKVVLLHSVPSSKMGLVVEDHPDVQQLQKEFGNRLIRVIDACQLRCEAHVIRKYLSEGCLVMVTGSKFYEAPSFCGAVFIPERFAGAIRDTLGASVSVPAGFGQYLTRFEIGSSFPGLRSALPRRENLGLLLRWEVALAWLEKCAEIGAETFNRVVRSWVVGVRRLIAQFADVELLSEDTFDDAVLVAGCNTIVSFKVKVNGAFLPVDPLKSIYALLWQDLSALATTDLERSVLGRQFQIGQPVKVCNDYAVLRFALGASVVIRMSEEGVEKELENDRSILEKLTWLVQHYDSLPKA